MGEDGAVRNSKDTPSHLSMALDLKRGTKQQAFWIMEQLAGPTGWEEIKQTLQELSPHMEKFSNGLPEAEVGILFSYDQDWALQIHPHHPDLNYIEHLRSYYKAFFDANVPVDIVSDEEDYSRPEGTWY